MVHQSHSIRWALLTLALATLLPSLGSSIANIVLPTLAASFSTSFVEVQWVVLAYLMTMTMTMVFAGRIGDRLGRRRLLVVGLVVITAASIVGSASSSLWLVVGARAAQGIGAGLVMAITISFVGDTVPRERTGRAMGLLGSMSALGTALGPSLGGLLVEAFGWRSVFLLNVPLGLVAAALVCRHLPAARPTSMAESKLRDQVSALFAPLRDRQQRASLVANLLVSAVMMATLVVGPFYLSNALALDAAAVGIVMSIGPIAAALLGVPAGRLVDRFGARRMILLGLGGIAVGAAFLALLPETLGVPGYLVPIIATTASYAIFQAANNTEVMRDVGTDRRGVVSGALNLSRNLGLIGGTTLMGAVFVAGGMHVTFAVATALILIAIVVMAARGRVARSPSRWWKVPALLLALSAVPAVFGAARLAGLGAETSVTPENARFFASPVPVIVHVIAAMLFSMVGAFQFAAEVRRRWPRWHRIAGRVVLLAGMVVAISGMWMTAFYPFPPALQGTLLFTVRMIVGAGMFAALVLAFTTIRRGDVASHRAWMMRAYALGLGAGTQVVVMLPWTLAFGIPTHLPYELLMTLAWLINVGVAERIIRRPVSRAAHGQALALARSESPSEVREQLQQGVVGL